MADFRVEQIPIPASLDDSAEAADFARSIEVGNAVATLAYATSELNFEPDEELAYFVDPHSPVKLFVVRVEGEIVARGTLEALAADENSAWVTVEVLPEFRGRGIGTALAEAIETGAREEGRRSLLVYIGVRLGEGAQIASPTEFGAIPASDPSVRFLLGRGYSFEQVERVSRLDLPVPDLEARFAAAVAASGPEFAVHTWVDRTPERWREDFAVMATRMSTDAPSAGLDEPEDVWTVERLVAEEERRAAMNPRRRLTAAAEHLPSGHIVAFSEISIPRQTHRGAHQGATLVLREHRGNRLGMLVKLANLVQLDRVAPGHPSVFTFNAEENRPMLDVNEAMGFAPIGSVAAWQKSL